MPSWRFYYRIHQVHGNIPAAAAGDEDEVVGTGKVLAQEPKLAQADGRHEMGVVNDGREHFAGAMDAEGLLDQQAFAVMIAALELDLALVFRFLELASALTAPSRPLVSLRERRPRPQ